ncbi:formate/nitrite transporter family protein [Oleiharenicola lentus]|uniref:formate/nitrite transporter family protein n=1 Tax=Oleiharenicola lentus TaxID=2508720 RepID=UPI003F66A5F3
MPTPPLGVDDRMPADIAKKAETTYAQKTDVRTSNLVILALLAGAYIAFGSVFSQVVLAGAEGVVPFGIARLLSGTAFSVGLILVVVGGAELFTGNILMVIPRAQERATTAEIGQAWGIIYVGNLVGSVAVAYLVFLAGVHSAGQGQVGLVMLKTASAKSELPFLQTVASGILANMLVCLAVWLSLSARTTPGKILAIIFPIAAFVTAGLEHSVANMSLIPMGLFIEMSAADKFWLSVQVSPEAFAGLTLGGLARNLAGATLGNILGGMLIGISYWFAYRRGK